MITAIVSRLIILLFGTLYPAYASYKAVKTKCVKDYVKWMMYWIVFAFFTCLETFTDVFLSFWFPFYYEFKVVVVIYLLSPATRGSSILYRNFIHPVLARKEEDIDEYINMAKEQGYNTMLKLGSKGVTYATNVIMQTAIKGGGGIVNHLRRSYSLSDLSNEPDFKSDLNRNSKLPSDSADSADVPRDPRLRTQRKPGGSHVDLYFPEMDIRSHPHAQDIPGILSQIRSTEDISSGYSSAEPLYGEGQGAVEGGNPLTRTASVGATRPRARLPRAAQAKKGLTTEEEADDFSADYGWPPPHLPLASLFPDLFNKEFSELPPQAFLSPEALQLIIANSMYRDQKLHNIYEVSNEKEVLIDNSEMLKDDSTEDAENSLFGDSNVIGEPKDNISNDQFVSKTDNVNTVEPESILNTGNDNNETINKIFKEEKDVIAEPNNSVSNDTFVSTTDEVRPVEPILNTGNDHDKKIDQTFKEEKNLDLLPTKPTGSENYSNKESDEINILLTEETKTTKEDKLFYESSSEHEENHECFEDASEGEILPAIIVSDQSMPESSENLSIQTAGESLKPTLSMESVASSGDQVFEDSLPDVAMVAGRDSPSAGDRKGKYNKGKAPSPPDFKRSVDSELSLTEDSKSLPNNSITAEPDLIIGSSQVLQSEFSTEDAISNVPNIGNSLQEKERHYITPYGRRDVSPTPSNQSKKDNSSFSKFLPKSGMGSLFSFWGNKGDSSPGNSRSPSNVNTRPPSSEMFYSPSSTSNIEYTPTCNDRENIGSVTPKLKLRQMSQSPSRRKRHDY